jgi:hypothetical protein
MRNQAAFFAFLFFISLSISAQEVGTVVFQIKPPIGTTVAKLGDTVIHNPKVVMPVGTYQLTLWAPYYGSVTKTVTVLAGETVTVQENLSFSQEVQDYRKALTNYNHQAIRQKVLPRAGTVVLIAGTTVAWIRARRFQQDALGWKEEYEHATVGQIADYERRFNESRRKSINAKVTLYSLSGLTLGGCYVSWKGHKKMKPLEKPALQKPEPPFELTSISSQFDGAYSSLYFTFKF